MTKFSILLAGIILFSCSSKDQEFCNCLKAGEELNDFSATLFTKDITKKEADKLKSLKATQKSKCANYQTMTGAEMLKRMNECK